MLRGMVPYADFHVTVATVAPVFWLAGLVGVYRVAYSLGRRAPKTSDAAENPGEIAVVAAAGFTFVFVVLEVSALAVLAGFADAHEHFRAAQGGGLFALFLFAVGAFIADLARKSRETHAGPDQDE
jgi:cytochrome c biogenesis protein CcdA